MKFKILICQLIILLTINFKVNGQKMPINTLVNTLYGKNAQENHLDTVLFLKNCEYDFFVLSKLSEPITVIYFSTNDSLNEYLKNHDNSILFKVNIIDIDSENIKLNVGLSKVSNEIFRGKNLLKFMDERIITCRLSNNHEWLFDKTIKVTNL